MIKVEYLSNNKKYLINVINILKKWNNKSFNEKDITIIATENNKFIGFYQIKEHDNDNTSYSPWLANVFIVPQKRKMGYSRQLLQTVPDILKDQRYNTIYLHTKLTDYYEKFGWKILCPYEKNDGIKRNIYIFKIKGP